LTEFSPEWQAILYARQNNIPIRFMDLPSANQFAIKEEEIYRRKKPESWTKQEINNRDRAILNSNGGEWIAEQIWHFGPTRRSKDRS
jgi:hypothetical protein